MNRRALLTLLPAAVATPAISMPGSPLRPLYLEWQRAKDEFDALLGGAPEELENALFARVLDIEQQAADFDPQTIEDLLWQIIFADDNGDMTVNIHQDSLVVRAYTRLGVGSRIRGSA